MCQKHNKALILVCGEMVCPTCYVENDLGPIHIRVKPKVETVFKHKRAQRKKG